MKQAITDIQGIGPAAAEALSAHGIKTIKHLSSISVERLAEVPGFSEARATRVIAAAAELLPAAEQSPAEETEKGKGKEKAGKGKKGKKEKKGKGKDKKKKKGKK